MPSPHVSRASYADAHGVPGATWIDLLRLSQRDYFHFPNCICVSSRSDKRISSTILVAEMDGC